MDDWQDTALAARPLFITIGHEYVLPIPGLYHLIPPQHPATPIVAAIVLRIGKFLPVLRPATVNVMLARLAWDGGGEENDITVPGERLNQRAAGAGVKVFCHLQA
jgi:hypothetical protein